MRSKIVCLYFLMIANLSVAMSAAEGLDGPDRTIPKPLPEHPGNDSWTGGMTARILLAARATASESPPSSTPADTLARHVLAKAGIRVGVCEMPRAGDGSLAAALAREGVAQVHALAVDAKAAGAARKASARQRRDEALSEPDSSQQPAPPTCEGHHKGDDRKKIPCRRPGCYRRFAVSNEPSSGQGSSGWIHWK